MRLVALFGYSFQSPFWTQFYSFVASCAGHFIEAHLDEGYDGGWLHVDMAGPGTNGSRGTGYGVGLVLSLLEAPGF